VVRHSAWETQAIRSSASTLCSTPCAAEMLVRRAVDRVPDTSCSLPPGRGLATALLGCRLSPAIHATLCRSVLPESHRLYKLGGQVAIAQQSHNAFFGTNVPSRSLAQNQPCHGVPDLGS
jgi:hypothetical protein